MESFNTEKAKAIQQLAVQMQAEAVARERKRSASEAFQWREEERHRQQSLVHHLYNRGLDVINLDLGEFLPCANLHDRGASHDAPSYSHVPAPSHHLQQRPAHGTRTQPTSGHSSHSQARGVPTKKKEKRTGTKTLPPTGEKFENLSPQNKMDYIVKNRDQNPGAYINKDRMFLIRTNPIAQCYLNCCNSSLPEFLKRHGHVSSRGKTKNQLTFSVVKVYNSKLSGCPDCNRSR